MLRATQRNNTGEPDATSNRRTSSVGRQTRCGRAAQRQSRAATPHAQARAPARASCQTPAARQVSVCGARARLRPETQQRKTPALNSNATTFLAERNARASCVASSESMSGAAIDGATHAQKGVVEDERVDGREAQRVSILVVVAQLHDLARVRVALQHCVDAAAARQRDGAERSGASADLIKSCASSQ